MKPFGLFKNPLFVCILIFLGIVLLFVMQKRIVDEGFAPVTKTFKSRTPGAGKDKDGNAVQQK